jgi:type II secretion system protein C
MQHAEMPEMWWVRGAIAVRQWLTVGGPRLIVFALGVAIAAEFVSFGLRLRRSGSPESPNSQSSFRAAPRNTHFDPNTILAAHLFGRSDAQTPSEGAAPAVTLTLVGVIATGQSHDGFAIIGEPNGVSHLYRVGSRTVAGSVLSEVFPDHVVLLRDETPEMLRLPHFGRTSGVSRVASAMQSEMSPDAGESQPSFTPPPLPTSGAVIRSLNLSPAVERGKRIGLRVVGTRTGNGSASLTALGLSAGDLVVNVNGTSLADGSPGGAGMLMRTISEGETATLGVERQGRLIEVTIDPTRADAAADLYRGADP